MSVNFFAAAKVSEAIQQHYEKFGEIIATRILNKNVSTVGLGFVVVELSNGRFAEAAILRGNDDTDQLILDEPALYNIWKPEQEEPKHQVEPAPLANILNAFKDNILQKVFGYLSLSDLCCVADTCKSFRKNAKQVFFNRMTSLEPQIKNLKFPQAESLFRNFGAQMDTVSLNQCDNNSLVLDNDFFFKALLLLMGTYCSANDKLYGLELSCNDNFEIKPKWHQLLRPLFKRWKHLRLINCNIGNLFDDCDELIELNVEKSNDGNIEASFTSKRFERLERLSLKMAKLPTILERMTTIPTLKSLELREDGEMKFSYDIIHTIGARFSNLEELMYASGQYKFIFPNDSMLDGAFAQLKLLRKFKLDNVVCQENIVGELRNEGVPVEWLSLHLDLKDMNDCSAFVGHISQCKQMQVLKINGHYWNQAYLTTQLTKGTDLKEVEVNDERFIKVGWEMWKVPKDFTQWDGMFLY